MVSAAIIIVLVLRLVFELGTQERSGNSSQHAMSAHLIPAKVSCGASAKCTHQTTVTLLVVGVRGAIILLMLTERILVLRIGALLRELLRRGLAGILLLLVVLAELYVRPPACFETCLVFRGDTYPCCAYWSP